MKKSMERIKLIMVLLAGLTSAAMAQTNPLSEYLAIRSNAEVNAQIMLNEVRSNAEYHRLHPTAEELEVRSNALVHLKPSQTWLETSNKQEILDHCAEILHSAIDTNQIEIAFNKLTNQPQTVAEIRLIAKMAISNLNMAAIILTTGDLNDYVGQMGYQARFSTFTNDFYFTFLTANGPIEDFHMRAHDGHILSDAEFYQNGKLHHLQINSFNNKKKFGIEVELTLNKDGTLNMYWKRPNETTK